MRLQCPACLTDSDCELHTAREMLLGTRETFRYGECRACGYLTLIGVPEDLGKYYPADYYSYRKQSELKGLLKAVRGAQAFGKRSFLGSLLTQRWGAPPVAKWLAPITVKPDARILDVGCGDAIALQDMRLAGFAALDGLEPFLSVDEKRYGRVRILKRDVFTHEGQYDVIILSHSFEHMLTQARVLERLPALLAPNGRVLIRMPTVGRAWKTFGTNWYGLDAPRHLSIHTQKSFAALVSRSAFEIERVVFDGAEDHYLASELYVRDIPHNEWPPDLFTDAEVAAAREQAAGANAAGEGDQANFYLRLRP